LLLVSVTTAPPEGAATVSWIETSISWPLFKRSVHGFSHGSAEPDCLHRRRRVGDGKRDR
jgi:hypothetical protein